MNVAVCVSGTVATLNYQEKYTCDSVKDFICNDMMNNTFVISTETSVSCMNGNVTLSPDGDLDIACQQSKGRSQIIYHTTAVSIKAIYRLFKVQVRYLLITDVGYKRKRSRTVASILMMVLFSTF